MKVLALILSLALVACRGPVVTHALPDDGLPPVPDTVYSPLGPIPIVWTDTLVGGEGVLIGGYALGQRRIYLNRAIIQSRALAHHTRFHEECHGMLYESGARRLMTDTAAQLLCDVYATHRVYELRAATRKP